MTNREIVVSPVSLPKEFSSTQLIQQIRELAARDQNIALVPAYPGDDEVRIPVNPAFISVDHGITLIHSIEIDLYNPEKSLERTNPSFYAVYLCSIGERQELRFVTLPVALFPNQEIYNRTLLEALQQQGYSPDTITKKCQLHHVKALFGYLDSRLLPSFRFLMKSRRFLKEDGHPEDRRWLLMSGWSPKGNLTIIGNPSNFQDRTNFWHQGLYNHFDRNIHEGYPGGIKTISEPMVPKTTGELETEILRKILTANR